MRILLFIVTLSAACGKDDTAPKTESSPTKTESSPPKEAAAPAPTEVACTDACTLVSEAEAARLLGSVGGSTPLKAKGRPCTKDSQLGGWDSSCAWTPAGKTRPSLQLSLAVQPDQAVAKETIARAKARAGNGQVKEVAGLGDEGFFTVGDFG